jgi:hypothetical protein
MLSVVGQNEGTINLQATLAGASAMNPLPGGTPILHHPISCQTELRLEEDGTFACEHAIAPPGDMRTQFCIDHSVALLLIELARAL